MKKGFTLIELLAVIIILAIVALIATPIVLDVVNDAKDSAAKSEASMIVSGVNNYCAAADMKEQLTGETNICEDGVEPEEVKNMVDLGNAKVNSITFDGKVTSLEVVSNGRTVTYNGNEYSINGENSTTPVSNFFVVSNDGVIKFDKDSFKYEDENGDSQWNTDLLRSSGWYDITTLNIPSNYNDITVTSIGKFSSIWDISDNLSAVNIPNSVTSLDSNCCQIDNLTWYVSDSLTFIGRNAFYDSNNHTLAYDGTSETFKNNVVIENIFENLSGLPEYIRCNDGTYNTTTLYDMRDAIVTDQVLDNFKQIIGENCDMYECDGTLKQLEEAANISINFE